MALAAEFKRASPSKGDIAVDLDIVGKNLEIFTPSANNNVP
jgi:indole-3-glycerol phosphate synthase